MIITNNQRVSENHQDALYINGDIHELYQKVRDLVYVGHKLHTYPLSASIGMLHSPVKSVILSDDKHHEETVRIVGLTAAEIIGEAARVAPSSESEVFELGTIEEETEKYPDLPKVAYVEMLISQGLLHDGYIQGKNKKE